MAAWTGLVPPLLVALGALALLAVGGGAELRRAGASSRRRLARLALLLVLVAALGALAGGPTLPVPAGDGPGVATLGVGPGGAPLRLERPGSVPEELPDAAALARRIPPVSRLDLRGEGLAPWEWEALPAVTVRSFEAPPARRGVLRVHWPRHLTLGEDLAIAGEAAAGARAVTLRLLSPGGVEAEVEVPPGDSTSFRFVTRPPAGGRFVYRLELVSPAGPVAVEELGVEVAEPVPPAVLWLEDAPSPESREVKRWLAAGGAPFALRSTISRGRVRVETHRVDAAPARLVADTLADWDLVVLEGRAAAELAASEVAALDAAMREEGLGVLLLADRRRVGGPAGPLAVPWRAGEGGLTEVRPSWPGGPSDAPPLPLPDRELLLPLPWRPLVEGRAGQALAAAAPRGRGTLGASLLAGTHRWLLLGRAEAHHGLWAHLVREVARPRPPSPWRLPDGPLRADLPLRAYLAVEPAAGGETGAIVELITPAGESWRVPPAAVAGRRGLREAIVWPRQSGWHLLRAGDHGEQAFHVGEREGWVAWEAAQRRAATRQRRVFGPVAAPAADPSARRAPTDRAPLFVLSVVAWGLLWGDERWRRRVVPS